MKTLKIAIDNAVKHRRYFILDNILSDDIFFEWKQALKDCKTFAKNKGYTKLELIRITKWENKTYVL